MSLELVGKTAGVAGGAGVAAVHVAHAGAGHPHRPAATHPDLKKTRNDICISSIDYSVLMYRDDIQL